MIENFSVSRLIANQADWSLNKTRFSIRPVAGGGSRLTAARLRAGAYDGSRCGRRTARRVGPEQQSAVCMYTPAHVLLRG